MSVSFMWEVVKPGKSKSFAHGTSSDVHALTEVFGGSVSTGELDKLDAMALASGHKNSLWSEIANTLRRLAGDNGDDVTIRVWPEY